MIIGDISLDPRKIINGQIKRKHRKYYLSILYAVGDSVLEFDVKCACHDEAFLWLLRLDKVAHKDNLLDAISDKSLEEIEADLDAECKIGFTC